MWLMTLFFFFKQKTAYEMRISDWSSDVCSSDLPPARALWQRRTAAAAVARAFAGTAGRPRGRAAQAARSRAIGRASCRGKSVSVRVDLGGRSTIKKKMTHYILNDNTK